jgi:hypothetical protein
VVRGMLRRLLIAGLVAVLVGPVLSVAPASATGTVLFTCTRIDPGASYVGGFRPGLSHTQTAQDARDVSIQVVDLGVCSNGERTVIRAGAGVGFNPLTTRPGRPLGCPVAWGGAGPDYPDQTPILFGGTDPSFSAQWLSDGSYSFGIAKVKQGAAGDQWRFVFNITTGKYAPPTGMKTKIKFTTKITPYPGVEYTCADDSDPLEYVSLTSSGGVIVKQK